VIGLTPVTPDALPFQWPVILPWIEAACERVPSELTPDALMMMCQCEEAQLVLIGDPAGEPMAAGVIQARDYEGGGRALWILALGGSGARIWRDTLKIIEDAARRMDCATVQFVGRAGWAGLLPDYACHVSYTKRLD
jgi:hypothetical protein